jgi:excinuclease ABC subunit B
VTITKDIRQTISIKEDIAKDVTSTGKLDKKAREDTIRRLEAEMKEAARRLDFETAAELRDTLFELKAESERT